MGVFVGVCGEIVSQGRGSCGHRVGYTWRALCEKNNHTREDVGYEGIGKIILYMLVISLQRWNQEHAWSLASPCTHHVRLHTAVRPTTCSFILTTFYS